MVKTQSTIRIVIADDSFFMRRLLTEIIKNYRDLEIVGEARDGQQALELANKLKPDVITMDYNMPVLNGAEATKKIMRVMENPPAIIMLSAHTREGAAETFRCLRAGALEYITKPSGELSLDINIIEDEIIEKIRTASQSRVKKYEEIKQREKRGVVTAKKLTKVVVIGASTGGPPLVENLVSEMPANLNVAVVIIQHMPKFFTEIFAERLNDISVLPVKEVVNGDVLEAGKMYLSPGRNVLKFTRLETGVRKGEVIMELLTEKVHSKLSTIDGAMASLATVFKKNIIAVLLTGMGEDGLVGVKEVKQAGGYVIAQDPNTAAVRSMPEAVIQAQLVDAVLSPEKIIDKIIEQCQSI